jgi:hypothetical protein
MKKNILTYSSISSFLNCRKLYKYRYIDELVPITKDKNLKLGNDIHNFLADWHRYNDRFNLIDTIDNYYKNKEQNEDNKSNYNLAKVMMLSYIERYPSEEFIPVVLEETFENNIINPSTNYSSRNFIISGKVDGLIQYPDGTYYLLEHKTTSNIAGSYLERLWTDFQISLYSYYIEQSKGIEIDGVLYNILTKAKLRQGKEETEKEFYERRMNLISKSKKGNSNAKRKLAESDLYFQKRLKEKYKEPTMFHREKIYISKDSLEKVNEHIWNISKSILSAFNKNNFYPNPSYCFNYNKPCSYYPICSSNENPIIIENYFNKSKPNGELRNF